MAYTYDETEYPIENNQQQEEWIMNNKFPQKQNTSEKLKAMQYGAAVALLVLAWIIWKKSRRLERAALGGLSCKETAGLAGAVGCAEIVR